MYIISPTWAEKLTTHLCCYSQNERFEILSSDKMVKKSEEAYRKSKLAESRRSNLLRRRHQLRSRPFDFVLAQDRNFVILQIPFMFNKYTAGMLQAGGLDFGRSEGAAILPIF